MKANVVAFSRRLPVMVAVLIALSAVLFHPATARAEDDLITAARTGNVALARKAVRRGADVNAGTALNIAAANNHPDLVAFLIEAGADVNKPKSSAPLITAVSKGHVEISRLLLEAGADLTAVKDKEKNPIGVLADWSNPELAQLLKSYGVDINASNNLGDTVAHRQTGEMRRKLNSFSMRLTLNPSFDRKNEMEEALRLYRAYFDAGANPDARNRAGQTPLMMLANSRDGAAEAIRVLLAVGADPNIRDGEGNTALDIASRGGDQELMAALAEGGSDPNADPLILFKALRSEDRLRTLLEAGADPNAIGAVCKTRYRMVVECSERNPGKVESLHILHYAFLSKYWTVSNEEDKKRIERNLGMVRMLLQAGSDPNAGAPKNALWHALAEIEPSPVLVRLLLEYGATLEGIGLGYSRVDIYLPHIPYLLHSSSTEAYSDERRRIKREVVAAWLESGADPNDANPETGVTPLRIEVQRGEIGIVRTLINAGAAVASDNVDGSSILDVAVKSYDDGRSYPRAVCSRSSGECEKFERFVNARQYVKDRRAIIAELVKAGSVPANEVSEDVRRHVVRGGVLARQARSKEDYSTVIGEFKKAQKLAPTWPEIYYKMASVYEAGENFPAALENYEIYLALLPKAANRREVQDKIYELEVLSKTP